ncbi:hypothetical protein [Verrucomicrobium sp. BvORR106]|uniref:hypothetical protein n=1 Tax=Verrucomicrobium sp. BvORR106 TaxID=1403819 RepID=UPI00056F55F9|nr:hypothetical protein [Verrucomicrobium sp. BvORR106]
MFAKLLALFATSAASKAALTKRTETAAEKPDATPAVSTLRKPSSIAEAIAEAAESQIGIRESEGQNRGPGIEKFWTATSYKTGYQNREPWCAAFVCWCILEALLRLSIKPPFKRPTTAQAFGFEPWATYSDTDNVKLVPTTGDIRRGDIIVYSFSHVEIATKDTPKSVNLVECVGGNTNDAGSREGDGVYRKQRRRKSFRAVVRIE